MSKITSNIKIIKQMARETFNKLFERSFDYETENYQQFFNPPIHPMDIMIEDLEESNYKDLRILDKHFNPNCWKEDKHFYE